MNCRGCQSEEAIGTVPLPVGEGVLLRNTAVLSLLPAFLRGGLDRDGLLAGGRHVRRCVLLWRKRRLKSRASKPRCVEPP